MNRPGIKAMALIEVLAAMILGLACASCGESSQPAATGPAPGAQDQITIILIPKVTGNAFFESANAGAQAYAAGHGFKVDYRGSPEASVDRQIEIVEQAIREKANGLSISALDARALDRVLKKAMDSGIAVTTWDSDAGSDARRLMVSQGTPSQLGKMLVEMASKSLLKRGKSPSSDHIRYAWHYSQATVSDQNSWYKEGEEYIRRTYPNWENVAPQNYYSEQDSELALAVGKEILETHPDIDAIICNDSTSLPGQAAAARELGLDASKVTITGFASPNAMKEFAREGIIDRWGLWDCQIQAAIACYLTWRLASGQAIATGQVIEVPEIGLVEVMPNTVLDPSATNLPYTGVVLLPSRTEFTIDNMDGYDF
jgi:AI-2 transport system substrate-binding protein